MEEGKISADEAAEMLLEEDENGEYIIGDLRGESERENLTRIVGILNQIDLDREDENGYKNLRKALAMIGAYDRYCELNSEEKINKYSEYRNRSAEGDMVPARMYVHQFFQKMDIWQRTGIEEKFNDGMRDWLETSREMLEEKPEIAVSKLAKAALEAGIGTDEVGDGEQLRTEERGDSGRRD